MNSSTDLNDPGKICKTGCGQFKPLSLFSINTRNCDGHENKCKDCVAKYRKLRSDRIKEKEEEKITLRARHAIVPSRSLNMHIPYQQEKAGYVRNDGNKQIKSLGLQTPNRH